jgi:NAD(P)H dehydrogenase (quinone)
VIAVTGAGGYVGGRVASLLSERGEPVRAIVRDASRAPAGFEARVASGYGAAEEMRAALEGCSTLFLVPAEESLDRVDQTRGAQPGRGRGSALGAIRR